MDSTPVAGPIRAIIMEVRRDERRMEDLTGRVARRIRADVPEYRAVPEQALRDGARQTLVDALTYLLEGRQPADQRQLAAVAGDRSRQGISLAAVLGGYRAGGWEAWNVLSAIARQRGVTDAILLSAMAQVWRWLENITVAAALAHREVELEAAKERDQRLADTLGQLLTRPGTAESAARQLAELGLATDGTYRAIRGWRTDGATIADIRTAIGAHGLVASAADRGVIGLVATDDRATAPAEGAKANGTKSSGTNSTGSNSTGSHSTGSHSTGPNTNGSNSGNSNRSDSSPTKDHPIKPCRDTSNSAESDPVDARPGAGTVAKAEATNGTACTEAASSETASSQAASLSTGLTETGSMDPGVMDTAASDPVVTDPMVVADSAVTDAAAMGVAAGLSEAAVRERLAALGTFGIGTSGPAGALHESYLAADRAVRAAAKLGQSGVHSLHDLRLAAAAVDNHFITPVLSNRLLEPLRGQRAYAREIWQAVVSYLRHGMRVEDAAAELHVHGNTLRHRLSRYSELTGVDFRDTGDIAELWWLATACPDGLDAQGIPTC